MARRKRTEWGDKLVMEWARIHRAGLPIVFHQRLGPLLPRREDGSVAPAKVAMLAVFNGWVDALIVHPDHLELVEATVRGDSGKVSKILEYRDLVPQTPELEDMAHLPIQMTLLYAVFNESMVKQAMANGIETMRYIPPWLDDWFVSAGVPVPDVG